ncbi:ECF transporter S component [Miniphocaeibacter massiliensis]|uniref:ECF transporter S component n=1 Tax=Miniphocaeibacter massiliensis TaxID=2041841 RepID=UPI000C084DB7|nr:ECF transporter S component [Miniphocaeibacter massiliensis]
MRNESLSRMIKVALLGAIAMILMFAKVPLPFAPPFMSVDIAEVPAIIAGFTFGPLYGFLVIVIKLILNLIVQGSSTGGIGEISNLVVSSAFVLTASFIYKRKRTLKSAIFALSTGVMLMTILAVISNYYVIFPLYGANMSDWAKIISKTNPLVNSVPTFLLFSIVPFNVVKGVLNAVVATTLYKPLRPVLNKK